VTLAGTVTASNGAAITDRGFYWKTAAGVTTSDNKLSEGGTTVSAFSQTLGSLSANTIYYYRAYAVNSAGTNLGSSDVSFYTLANTPTAPTVNGATSSSLNVTLGSGDGNPSTTAYAIQETSTTKYVQADGSLNTTAVYQTAATWGTKTVTGLSGTTTYTFQVQAQNGAGTATAFGPTASGTTLATPVVWNFTTASPANVPNNVTVSDVSQGNNNGTTILITGTSSSSGYTGASAGNNAGAAAFTGALVTGTSTYFAFTVTPANGYKAVISAASFGSRSTSTGPQAYTLRSSADNYASDLFTGTLANNSAWVLNSQNSLSITVGSATSFRLYGFSGSGATTAGTANWRIDDLNVTMTVSLKTTPTITTAPTATAITYGQSLASSTLSGGVASVAGTFAFTTPSTAPGAGTAAQGVTFTPTDTANYNTATTTASVQVNPATLTYTANAASMTYGGTVPSLSGTVTGFVNGENQAGATTGTLIFTTSADSSSPAGSYAINGSGLTAANYTFVQATGNSTAFSVNPAPGTFSIATTKNTPAAFNVSKIIYYANAGGTPMTVAAVNSPSAHGTVDLSSGIITYTPATDYTGSDSFTYTLSAGGATSTGTVDVTINDANVSPTLSGADDGTGKYKITTSGKPTTLYDVQAQTTDSNVTGPWTTIGSTTSAANGVVSWTDSELITAHQMRIYRLKQH
jgi:hypothetical protein